MASRQNGKTRIVLQHSRKAFRSPAGPDLLLVVFSGRLCDGVPDWQGTAMRVHLCGTLARGGLGHEARAHEAPFLRRLCLFCKMALLGVFPSCKRS